MNIVICGAGTTGRHVARALADVHDIVVIDRREDRRIADGPHVRFVVGDAADPAVLMRSDVRDADAIVACTPDDATNLLIALVAKRRLGVRWTVAQLREPAHRWLFGPTSGVDVVVSPAELVARLVQEEVTAGDLVTVLRLHGDGVAVTETVVPPGAALAGTAALAVELPEGVALTAVIRNGQVRLPERAGALRAGDVVVALCEAGREHVLHQVLTRPAA